MIHAVLLAAALLAVPTASDSQRSVADLQKEARAAYDKGDKARFLAIYEDLTKRRPGDSYLLYNLACGQALSGQSEAAGRTLLQLAALRVVYDLDADDDLASIRGGAAYRAAAAKMKAVREGRVSSGAEVAFTIPEKGLVPEGVAFDPKTKSFFVSSIRKREVFRVDPSGKASVFVAARSGGLRSAAGIAVDPRARSLWVASEAMPHMEGHVKDEPLQSAVFEFDADTGAFRRELKAPALEKPPAFDDVAVGPDGRLWVNDGFNGRIFTLAPGGKSLEVFLDTDLFRGTQGIAPTPDGKALYVSDYSGLYRVELASKSVTRLSVPPKVALNGADGLVLSGGSLFAVQNGIQPNRVSRVDLGPDGITVTGGRILEMNNPAFDEPTLAVAVDGFLYVNAASQGGRFQNEKRPITPEEMREAVVLKIPLAGAPAADDDER